MIKKSVFEEELVAGMHQELIKNATNQDTSDLGQAVEYLNSAIDILEDTGMSAQADQVLHILMKIATDTNDAKKPKDPRHISDRHTKGLSSEKMVSNLKHHGTVFNMADDGKADDLLDLDMGDAGLQVSEDNETETFEDERD